MLSYIDVLLHGRAVGERVAIGITDSAFIMGSMGSVVGERLARLVERATEQNLPLIIISGSGGGARLFEQLRTELALEGVHLVPGALPRAYSGAVVVQCLLAIEDEDEHARHFWVRDMASEFTR